MKCEQIRESLLEYSLRPSNCPERETISEHLKQCESCRQALEQERVFAGKLADLAPVSPVSDMWPVIRSRVHQNAGVWSRFASWLVWPRVRRLAAAGMAALALVAIALVGIQERSSRGKQAAAVSHLVQMQSQSQVSAANDDPLGASNDRILAALEEGS